ncbi:MULTISPECIES: glycosyltransferase family 2 protein [Nostoc]|uniref:Glycosyltransferase n=1 Tax=Nostoc paludosum FACHB-159 TaxID=2692908 RepID=A0ABR8K7M8_9NOSO|nr:MULTISPECIES: glycosyltransferase family 2 protein [Nostoc]MBD2676755.1 glycosyltransferase [Nostoc sp. FACHB-857]MBD2734943.1 glycosyltransferase [Nostoc paludosum FACHB-159]
MVSKYDGFKDFAAQEQSLKEKYPKISVITVSFNRLEGLRETFSSIISQTYKNVEYIIIDGGSQDGTVDFLNKNSANISYWVSEKDAGIYDAMNKGALAATGDWIIFMNCGDKFFAEDTLAKVAEYLNNSVDVVYGRTEYVVNDKYGYHTYQRQPYDLSIIWREIPSCHQSIFVKRELQVKYPFDTLLTWCADHDLVAKIYVAGYRFQEVPVVISRFDVSGGASRDLLSFTKERWSICRRYFGKSLQQELYFMNEYKSFWLEKNIISKIREMVPSEWILTLRKYRKIY